MGIDQWQALSTVAVLSWLPVSYLAWVLGRAFEARRCARRRAPSAVAVFWQEVEDESNGVSFPPTELH